MVATELVDYYQRADALTNAFRENQLEWTTTFIAEQPTLITNVYENVLKGLDRFHLDAPLNEKTARELTFLWTQAKMAQSSATLANDNRLSQYNIGVAAGVHLHNPDSNRIEFAFAHGANREPDNVAIAIHAETSAIESLRQQLLFKDEKPQPVKLDMIALTGATPCGSCREEIYRHRTSDNTLVAVINDDGTVAIDTIAELFPTVLQESDLNEVPPQLLSAAHTACNKSVPSQYQTEKALPLWGVALGLDNGQFESGSYLGDAAFWSNTPTSDALRKIANFYTDHKPYDAVLDNPNDYWKDILENLLSKVKKVVFYYSGKELEFYPSGKERQQLTILPEDTVIYIVLGDSNKVFKTTRGELIPAAFTA